VAALLGNFDLRGLFGGKIVLVKPNLCGEPGEANTDPRVIYGVVKALEQYALRVIVGDGSMVGAETGEVMRQLGLPEALRETKAELVDFKRGNYVTTPVVGGRCINKMLLAEAAANAGAIVSVAKLKTKAATAVSLSMKNLKGVLHEYDMLHFHHVNLTDCLVDLVGAVKPALSIVDGIVALDAYGAGPVALNCVIAGEDPVAVDATAARAIGVDPAGIYAGTLNESHIKKAGERGFGEVNNINVIGDLPLTHFAPPPAKLNEIRIPDGMEIIDGNPCPACVEMLGSVLRKLPPDHKPSGKTTILVGPNAPPPDQTKGRTIIIGNCLHRLESEGSVFVIGCPPNGTYDVLPVLKT